MATAFSGQATSAPMGPFASQTIQSANLGSRFETADGRVFRYCLVGATALVPGQLYQAPAEITNHQNLTPTAAAISATSLTVTLGATAATANQYAGGYAIITVTPGQGYTYRISSNPAAALSTALTLQLDDAIQVALTTSSRVDLFPSPWSGVIVNPTTASSAALGVAIYPAAAATYSYLQTEGPVALLADGTITVGTNVVASNATAGAVEAGADATDVQSQIGTALTGGATTEYVLVDVHLD